MREPVGIGGVVAALSVTSDLTRGHPPGEAMRACLLATELARRAGLDETDRRDVYYATLMRFAGCAATSHEIAAALGGDDIVVRARGDLIDPSRPAEALRFLAGLGEGAGRLRVLSHAPGVAKLVAEGARADCEVGAEVTRRLRLPEPVIRAVLDGFERFDGRGVPAGRAGAEVAEAARFAAVGYAGVMFDAVGGGAVAAETVARWSGRALDPTIAAIFLDAPDELLRISNPDDLWAAVVDAEPAPRRAFRDDAALDAAGAPPPALPPLPADLTERELDVLRRLVAGRTKRQIAAELVISQSTVHTHTVHIYGKCGVSTRAGLAMFAMQHGLAARPGAVAVAGPKID